MAVIVHPPSLINAYLADKIDSKFEATNTVPFLPSMPTDIDALTETFPSSDGRFAVYDRMFRMRRGPFPHIKLEQLMYYFYKYGDNAVENIIEIAQLVHDYLDREDESAEEVNAWVKTKIDPTDGYVHTSIGVFKPVYFHSFKIYQLQETRDIIDFGTARTFAGNKIIIDYKYHIPNDFNSN
jgi:hypothetical protein